jgi:hypothetical protein
MGIRLKVPFVSLNSKLSVRGGGVLTFVGTGEGQAVYWYIIAIDPREGEGPWPSVGRLQRPRYRNSGIRYGTNFNYGIRIPYDAIVRWFDRISENSGVTFTDKSKHATNMYIAPRTSAKIKYGLHYKYGDDNVFGADPLQGQVPATLKWGMASGLYDRVTVKVVLD